MNKPLSQYAMLLKKEERLDSLFKIKQGKVALFTDIFFENRECPFYYLTLNEGSVFGYEFFVNKNLHSNYSLMAIAQDSTLLESLYDDFKNIDQLGKTESIDVFYSLLDFQKALTSSFNQLQQINAILEKLIYSMFAATGYISNIFQVFNRSNKKLNQKIEEVFSFITSEELEEVIFPFNKDLFKVNFDSLKEKKYHLESKLNAFMQRIHVLKPVLGKAVFEKDDIIRDYFIEHLSFKIPQLIDGFETHAKELVGHLEDLFGENNLFSIFHNLSILAKSRDITEYSDTLMKVVLNTIKTKVLPTLHDYIPSLYSLIEEQLTGWAFKLNESKVNSKSLKLSGKGGQQLLKDSVKQILDYSGLPDDFVKDFLANYNKWRITPNKMYNSSSVRPLKKYVTEHYWRIYTRCFVEHLTKGKDLIKPVELMFKYGFFDETLLSAKNIDVLLNKKPSGKEFTAPLIYDTYEWLHLIAHRVYEPSMSAMGQSYDMYLKEKLKLLKKSNLTYENLDTESERVSFEIENFVKEATRLSNGNFQEYMPLLVEEQFPSAEKSIFENLTHKEKIDFDFQEQKKIDFSAFYREVRFRTEGIEEFIQQEVLPIIILAPNAGKRSGVWQAKERLKASPGRLLMPRINTGNLRHMIVYLFGYYRWEIVKELLGPLWNDISQGSITAEYTDYIYSVKKNKDLSEEVREKVLERFKKIHTDRDKFLDDYTKWILSESYGRPLLNKVSRDIFYRKVPFPAALREKLSTTHVFTELYVRYNNIAKREKDRLKLRYHRYAKLGPLPEELEEFIAFQSK